MKKVILVLLMAALMLALTGCSCKHEKTELVSAVAATCTQAGYEGDTVCTQCNEVVKKGAAIPAAGHAPGAPVNVKEAHCEWEGYTGDVYCTRCNTLLTQGEVLPILPHQEDGSLPAEAATCEKDGKEASVMCSRCLLVTQPGAVIPAPGHQWQEEKAGLEPTCMQDGYTAERICTVCGKQEPSRIIEKLADHPWDEKGVCTACGWMKPGLYVNDEMVMSWEDMEKNGYALVEKGKLIEVKGNMQMGRLVVGEDVTYLHGILYKGINNDTLREVWLPRSVTEIDGSLLYKNPSVTDVRLFCQLESLKRIFQNASALERVVLPQSLRWLGESCFDYTPALKEVNLPEGLEYIGSSCFSQSSIETLTLPGTLVRIDNDAFWGSALKEITLPASLTRLGNGVFAKCPQLAKVDMSACAQLTDMSQCISFLSNNPALTQVLLPPHLEKLPAYYNMVSNATALKHIALPEGITALSESEFEGTPIESVVWPVSLIEAGGLANCDLTEIFYRGSEAQWKMTTASILFPDARITFNYTGE